jgi:hypothetical protein
MKQYRGNGHVETNEMFGHVEIVLRPLEQADAVEVSWSTAVDASIKARIDQYARWYLEDYTGYAREHAQRIGLAAEVVFVASDPVRQNDYERATWVALHTAIVGLGLYPPLLYAPPDEDETAPK